MPVVFGPRALEKVLAAHEKLDANTPRVRRQRRIGAVRLTHDSATTFTWRGSGHRGSPLYSGSLVLARIGFNPGEFDLFASETPVPQDVRRYNYVSGYFGLPVLAVVGARKDALVGWGVVDTDRIGEPNPLVRVEPEEYDRFKNELCHLASLTSGELSSGPLESLINGKPGNYLVANEHDG